MTSLTQFDPYIAELISKEEQRQRDKIRLIASENYVSKAVLEASGSVLTNKYSEGYARARYYEGQQNIDLIEECAIERAKKLFGAEHVNVQPYSGSPANLAVYFAFMQPGDTFLSLSLRQGGHLTHGAPVSLTGKYFKPVFYELNKETELLDYDAIRALALEHKPKMIVAGHSAYPRQMDFAKFRAIADEVGAILWVDMAHFAGLVAGGAHPSPIPYADVVTTTTHKTLRGPRSGMILCKEIHAKAMDKAVFPGLQGGPHNHTTAAVAVAMQEALDPSFKDYAAQIVKNAKAMAEVFIKNGFRLISGGTDNHLILMDVTTKGLTGKVAAKILDEGGIVLNYNAIPYDPRKPNDPSGIRMGAAAITSRGFKEAEAAKVAEWMCKILSNPEDAALRTRISAEIAEFCKKYPAPGL